MSDNTISVPTPGSTITETAAPVTEAPNDALVSRPLSNPKPYDDEVFESYANDQAQEKPTETLSDAKPTEEKAEAKPAEEKKEEGEGEGGKEREGDTVKDGIEEVALKQIINGKQVEFKVKDAIQAYVKQEEFNRNMDRRVRDVTSKERRWEAEQSNAKSVISKVMEAASTGDFVTTIKALAKMAVGDSGLDVTKFEKQYFDQLEKIRDVYSNMTPEQREAYFAKRALAEAQERAKKLEEEKTATTESSQLQAKVESLQKEHNVPQEVFWDNFNKIAQGAVGEGKRFKSADDIKPEDVIQFTLLVRHEEKVVEACKREGVADTDTLNRLSEITATDPTITVDEMVRILKSAGLGKTAPKDAVENLNRKAEKGNARLSSQGSSTKKDNGKIDGYDEESLNFLYRKQPKVVTRPVR